MVFDNNLMFDIYKKRFQHIYSITEDYVPGEVINKYKEGKLISMVDFTARGTNGRNHRDIEEREYCASM